MSRERFDPDLLDPEDPFEIDDGNRPHLYKHLSTDDSGRPIAVDHDDILDLYLYGEPVFYEGSDQGAADWLMFGQLPGIVLCVPLAPPNSQDVKRCRPIGIYKPSAKDRRDYLGGGDHE